MNRKTNHTHTVNQNVSIIACVILLFQTKSNKDTIRYTDAHFFTDEEKQR